MTQSQPTQSKLKLLNIQQSERLPLLLLVGQAFFYGFGTLASYSASNALFLVDYGSKTLPYVYIVTALVVPFISYSFAELQKRRTLAQVMLATVTGFIAIYFVVWLGLVFFETQWLSFALMVLHLTLLMLGAILLGAQAGQLFNLHQMKRLFPTVVAGQLLSVILGGLLIPLLLPLLGKTENLVLLISGSLLIFLTLMVVTISRFPAALSRPRAKMSQRSAKSLFQLLKKRYVMLIFAYQILSAIGTQLGRFLFINQAEAQFDTSARLAAFFGNFLGTAFLVTFFFSMFAAGRLLTHFGLKFGLTANPVGVAVAVTVGVVVGIIFGPVSLFFFWSIIGLHFIDYILDFGITNASIKTAYQPLPADERVATQSGVEGVGIPLAYGFTGVSLLIFFIFPGLTLIFAVLIIVTVLWTVAGVLVYRQYGNALMQTLAKRQLSDPAELVADQSSIAIFEQGLDSPQIGVVAYSLDMLEELSPETVPAHLSNLLGRSEREIKLDVLRRIEHLHLTELIPLVRDRFAHEGSRSVQGASLRTLAALGEPEVFDLIYPYLDDPNPELQQGALIGLLKSGELEGVMAAGEKLLAGVNSSNAAEREFAAYILGESGLSGFYRPLLKLIYDDQPQVQRAALVAAGKLKHSNLWPAVVDALAWPQVRALAASALVAGGQDVLPALQTTVNQNGRSVEVMSLVARICGRIGGEQAIDLLYKQATYPDERVRTQILLALSRCGYHAGDNEAKAFVEQQIQAEIAQATWLLGAQVRLGEDEQDGRPSDVIALLNTALENSLARHRLRLFEWLSFIHDPASVLRVRDILSPPEASVTHKVSDQQRAYALEVIDVLLPSQQKELILSLVRNFTPSQRLRRLSPHFPQPDLSRNQYLEAMISGSPEWFSLWNKVCALYAVEQLGLVELTEIVVAALSVPEAAVRETAIWALARLDVTLYRQHTAALANDPSPLVVRTIKHTAETGEHTMLSTVEKVILLKSLDFFAETSEEVLLETASILEEVEVSSGETFLEKGEVGSSMYLLIEGQVRVHDGERTVAQLGQGDVIGELALLDPAPRSASVTAINETRLFRLDQAPFYELLEDRAEVARKMLQVMAQRLRQSSKRRRVDLTQDDLLGGLQEKSARPI